MYKYTLRRGCTKIPQSSLASLRSQPILLCRCFKTDAKPKQAVAATSYHDDPLFPGVLSPYSSSSSSSWSSPYDAVPRHQFLKSYSHLLTLLEACLESGNFARAESVLISFSEHASPKGVAMAVNKYLLRLADAHKDDSSVAYAWATSISQKVPAFRPDTITYAILLKNKCLATDYGFDIKTFLKQHSPAVLQHVDVLGIGMIAKIVQLAELPLSEIDPQFRNVVGETIAASGSKVNNAESVESAEPESAPAPTDLASVIKTLKIDNISSLSKPGAAEIQAVESYGLKAIKHSLSGFVTDAKSFSDVIDTISPYVAEKSVATHNYTDFFELVRELEASEATPEQKAEFYKQFETYNWARQKAIERKGLESASLKWKYAHDQMREAGALSIKPLEALFWEWSVALQPLLEQEVQRIQETLREGGKLRKVKKGAKKKTDPRNVELVEDENDESLDLSVTDRVQYGPYLLLVKPQKLAVITILELFKLVSTGGIQEGMKTARAVLSVGKAVESEFKSAQASARERTIFKGARAQTQTRDTMMAVQDRVKSSELGASTGWSSEIRAKVGSLLISLLIHVAKVPVVGKNPMTGEEVRGKAPAFYHGYQYQGGTRVGVLKVHNYLSKFVSGDKPTKILQPQLLPMLVRPQPWKAWRTGGYLYSANTVMRVKDAPEQQAYLKAASEQGRLERVYEGLNVLGDTAWTVNTQVFEVVSQVWNKNMVFLDIPKDPGDLVLPAQPDRSADPQVRRAWLRECRKVSNEHTSQYSQRCTINYKLEIARAFLGERFYFPHNMDFRGRAYPLSPHLNHLGDDLSRGLLKFWKGRRLGKSGLRWLKIHAANVFGYDKFSFDEREAFIDGHLAEVRDSAVNPLEGSGWWQEGADAWQTLAACIELNNALSLEDPESYVSHLPVHQDGTCNGLQHYAALGGDIEGARQVNLVPSDRPQDIYSKVLEIVQGYVDRDAKSGHAIAELLRDKLVRKVVKQTVMTTVYGVTFIGARAQIASQLKEKEGIDESNIYQCSMYLTRQVFLAVRSLFEGAHKIQDWLGDSASKIAKCVWVDYQGEEEGMRKGKKGKPEFMSSVIWTTPLGLPIVQPYRETRKIQVSTKLQTVQLADPYAMRAVNARKQKTAFPPNYIHSLDASHMLLSAGECGREGLDFASVHDSYWTHAADVDKMNGILRDAFIGLHKVDLVAQLREEFVQRYGGMLEFIKIPRESEVGRKVVEARRALVSGKPGKNGRSRSAASSLTAEEEIGIERERLGLLNSGEEEEVERGKRMVTPLSIMEGVSEEEVKRLVEMGLVGKGKKSNSNLIRSTEHVGSGLDKQEEEEEKCDSLSEMVGGKSDATIGVFIRLRIDEVPEKGEFDVHDLVESKYFFS